MFLLFTVTKEPGHEKKYAWWFSDLESALDVLSAQVAKGKCITQAELTDNEQRLALPIGAFDGACFSAPLQQLQHQWGCLLGAPIRQPPVGSVQLISATHSNQD